MYLELRGWAPRETRARSLDREDPLAKDVENPFQYSCPENPMDRRAWRAACSPWGPQKSSPAPTRLNNRGCVGLLKKRRVEVTTQNVLLFNLPPQQNFFPLLKGDFPGRSISNSHRWFPVG